MRTFLLLPMLLVACSQPAENTVEPAPPADANTAAPALPAGSITGVYEASGRLTRPDRMCLSGEGGEARFGLVVGSDGLRSCTARGRVNRAGPKLTLVMDGDPACTLTAFVTDVGFDLDAATGRECSYYCGQGTRFQAVSFRKDIAAGADTRPVVDLVGEPLCR